MFYLRVYPHFLETKLTTLFPTADVIMASPVLRSSSVYYPQAQSILEWSLRDHRGFYTCIARLAQTFWSVASGQQRLIRLIREESSVHYRHWDFNRATIGPDSLRYHSSTSPGELGVE